MVLLTDGRLAVTYGYGGERRGIRARGSADNGRTWGDEIILRDDARTWDFGYPRTKQREDGSLVTMYYYTTTERPEQQSPPQRRPSRPPRRRSRLQRFHPLLQKRRNQRKKVRAGTRFSRRIAIRHYPSDARTPTRPIPRQKHANYSAAWPLCATSSP